MAINILLLSVLGLIVISLHKFLRRVWWDPIRITKSMEVQGIRGPPYKFLHGSTKEAMAMIKESMSKPMELSHNITPRVQPHLHAWIKEYGKNFFNTCYLNLTRSIRTGFFKEPSTSYVMKVAAS